MTLFRSEEHARAWSKYDPAEADRTMFLAEYVRYFDTEYHRQRLAPDYFLNRIELQDERDRQRADMGT